ncbi:hypothetical protein NYS52_18010 [Curtobacterium flaccumfaciens pv. flaccumfaciens]|uniref:hypothetical protein n=1 Tax=Curtobacterium poinsettiae TaxID=159612 RepID=UPI00217D8DC5|nr:hypothetical protein [Curtobacterium flaccumfaciens]MCS6576426.1 hypothetical protein [Curtobacterium flaccumfaciens pv. flaccumfaciens]
MLYLVRPYASLQWNDFPTRLALEAVAEHEVDLAKLDWDLSDHKATTEVIRLAVRHGVACSTGIVLPGIVLSNAYRASDLQQIHQDFAQSRAKAQTPAMEQFMESIMPGWIKRGEELDAQIDQSNAEFLRKANEGRAKLLAAAPQPDLVAHWEALGGDDPQ